MAAGAALAGVGAALRGRGSLAPPARVAPGTVRQREAYGTHPRQVGEWWVPPGAGAGPLPTVVLVHGGYWRPAYDLSLEQAVAADLAGTVRFRASWQRPDGDAGVLEEHSRFVRESGRWLYVGPLGG